MRLHGILTGLLIGASGLAVIAAPAAGQVPVPQPPAAGDNPPPGPAIVDVRMHDAMGISGLLVPVTPPIQEKAVAGLSEQAPAERLTWDRVYAMALVRARSGGASDAESLDPKALADQARRHGVADFARFRKEFLAGRTEAGAAFHDPGATYLEILRRLQTIDDTRQQVARLENLLKLVQELIQGESGGLSQIDIDLIAHALVRARGRMSGDVAGYRAALDDLKPALGLSPHAAVIPDRRDIAAFDRVFQAVEAWQRRPDRQLAELPRIVERLPTLGGAVVVDGAPILPAIEPAPGRMEDVLRDAARLAIRNHAGRGPGPDDGGVALELRVRRRIRQLLEIRRGYEDAKRMYVLAVRLQDQAFERMLTASSGAGGPSRTPVIQGVVDAFGRIPEAQDRLIAHWTSFRAERLALYRDLGVLPYDNWDAFYADLSAPGQPAAEQAPAAAPAGPVPPPPPPTTSAPASPVARPGRP